jgi:hypothetical protein
MTQRKVVDAASQWREGYRIGYEMISNLVASIRAVTTMTVMMMVAMKSS